MGIIRNGKNVIVWFKLNDVDLTKIEWRKSDYKWKIKEKLNLNYCRSSRNNQLNVVPQGMHSNWSFRFVSRRMTKMVIYIHVCAMLMLVSIDWNESKSRDTVNGIKSLTQIQIQAHVNMNKYTSIYILTNAKLMQSKIHMVTTGWTDSSGVDSFSSLSSSSTHFIPTRTK